MHAKLLIALLLALTLPRAGHAQQENIFFVNEKERPSRVVVSLTEELPAGADILPGMLGRLHGVIGDLKGAQLGKFLATPIPRTKLLDARGNLHRIGVAHLFGRETVKRVELLAGNEGVFLAQELDVAAPDASPRVARLDPTRFWALLVEWPRYQGTLEANSSQDESAAPPPGVLTELPHPYTQAPFHLDQQTLGDRFLRGRKSSIPPVSRVLAQETMFVRLPRGYTPAHPAGVLVWINAARDGSVPALFSDVLDELGLIAVGIQDVGNDREVADRYQLALDAAWTASRRFHIDPRRVYLSGISGGGHVVSMLQACFPDVFTGAVPIIGLKAYFNVPVGNGRFVRAGYERPEAKLWALTRQRRLAPITGDTDPNGVTIRQAAPRMAADGIPIRVFDYKGLGHRMPSADQFAEALRWVDAPYRAEREKEETAARDAMDAYKKKFGAATPENDRQRAELIRITQLGPWTAAAWEAVSTYRGQGQTESR